MRWCRGPPPTADTAAPVEFHVSHLSEKLPHNKALHEKMLPPERERERERERETDRQLS